MIAQMSREVMQAKTAFHLDSELVETTRYRLDKKYSICLHCCVLDTIQAPSERASVELSGQRMRHRQVLLIARCKEYLKPLA